MSFNKPDVVMRSEERRPTKDVIVMKVSVKGRLHYDVVAEWQIFSV